MAFQADADPEHGITDINITPFVDVVLVLLVIFMVTAPMMVKQAIAVKLPSSKTSDSTQTTTLGIAITKNGQFLLNGEVTTEKGLLEEARKIKNLHGNVQALIGADLDAKHAYVVKAIDIVRQAGISDFAFQVKRARDAEN